MSLLDTQPEQFNRTEQKVKRVLAMPSQLFNQILQQWSQGVSAIWDDETPQAILDGVGDKGLETFTRSAALAVFLESQKPGCTTEVVAKIKSFTVDNGRIVIAPN